MSFLFRKKSYWFLFLIGLAVAIWQIYINYRIDIHLQDSNGKEICLRMPIKDRSRLEYFLKDFMIWNDGGYTIFGNKPLSMNVYLKPFSTQHWQVFVTSLMPYNLRQYFGWKTWQKYQHLFTNTNFIIWSEENPFWATYYPSDNPAVSIFLLNKKKFQEKLNQHLRDFEEVLGRKDISLETFLLEKSDKPLLKSILKAHDGLIGTLFGYGRDNAWLFVEKEKGKATPLGTLWHQEVYDFFSNRPIRTRSWMGHFPKNVADYLSYPTFLADTSSLETKLIKEEFLKTRQEIIEYYKDKPFLEATLALFIEDRGKSKETSK